TSPYSGVLAKFITQMLNGEQPTIFGDGTQSRDFTYVDNAVEANLLAARAPADKVAGRVFNVATGTRVDLNQTFSVLKVLTHYSGSVKHEAERDGDIKHSLADISRAEKAFGYRPKVNFEEGLGRTVEWYKKQESGFGSHGSVRRGSAVFEVQVQVNSYAARRTMIRLLPAWLLR